MAKQKSGSVARGQANVESKEKTARSLAIAERGITHGHEFAELMSAMMTDLITGAMTPQVATATCNAGGKLLKIVEMQLKYGPETNKGNLRLTGPRA